MFQSEHLQEKWAPLLNYEGLDSIKDSHRRAVTAVLLENQERFLREQSSFETSGAFLTEASQLTLPVTVDLQEDQQLLALPPVSTQF
jgi:hypothetical protein